jgi:hypothetical protein
MTSDTSQPSDGKGDGNATTPTVITLDPTTLTLKEAVDYRRQLIFAICNPGTDYDMVGNQKEIDELAYKAQLIAVDNYINSFGSLI